MKLSDWEPLPGLTRAETLERAGLLHALRRTRQNNSGNIVNKAAAAKWLGLTRQTVIRRLKVFAELNHPLDVRARYPQRPSGNYTAKYHKQAIQLLKFFGIKAERRRAGSFWKRKDEEIQDILDAANKARLRMARQHFPDHGGDVAKAAEVNDTWRKVRKIFKQHGFEPG